MFQLSDYATLPGYSEVNNFMKVDDSLSWFLLVATLLGAVWSLIPEGTCAREPSESSSTPGEPKSSECTQQDDPRVEGITDSVTNEKGIATKNKGSKVFYLDNVKFYLTMKVLVTHAAASFNGQGMPVGIGAYASCFQRLTASLNDLNQSYFMALFFMISGFFAPGSLDRKGARIFLKERFKRLGLPGVFCWLVLGPVLQYGINCVFDLCPEYRYNPAFGPAWFVIWLLWFNVAYVVCYLLCPCSCKQDFPGILKMGVISALLGVVPWLLSMAFNDQSFVLNPNASWQFMLSPGFDQTFQYAVFFAAGILAKRNNWLTQMETLDPSSLWVYRFSTITTAVVIIFNVWWKQIIADPILADFLCQLNRCVYCVAVSVTELDFF